MKIKPKLPDYQIQQREINSNKKDELSEFLEDHQGWDKFVCVMQKETTTNREDLADFVKDLRKSIKKQEFRNNNILKTIAKAGDYLSKPFSVVALFTLAIGIPAAAASLLAVPTIGVITEKIDEALSKKQTKLEEAKEYTAMGDTTFAVLSPDRQKVIFGGIREINGERAPFVHDTVPVDGEFGGIECKEGDLIIHQKLDPNSGALGEYNSVRNEILKLTKGVS